MMVQGFAQDRFAGVKEVLAANLASGADIGASFCATINGETVVDIWGGHADPEKTRPWERDTIINVWSTTKTMSCLALLVLIGSVAAICPVSILAEDWPRWGGPRGNETWQGPAGLESFPKNGLPVVWKQKIGGPALSSPVLVDGVRTGTVGRVSMDMLAVDLTPVPAAGIGSEVTLWGRGPKGSVLAIDDVARAAGTIGYELMCALAPRVPVHTQED